MPKLSLLLMPMAAALAIPALAAPKPGDRTMTPQQILAQLGSGNSDAEVEAAIAAAAAHPLGSMQNPVRVAGPAGERAYIARLRCADGSRPKVGDRGSAGVGAFGSVVDVYPLDCGAAAPGRVGLVMDMYHEEHVETHAPPGFRNSLD